MLGAGGNAHDLLDTIDAINRASPTWTVAGLLDDGRELASTYLGLPILGPLASAPEFGDCAFVSGIWNETISRRLHRLLAGTGLAVSQFANLVHPMAFVSQRAHLANGILVHQAASIAGNVIVGNHVSIGPSCVVGHDTQIAGYTTLAAGAIVSGGVRVGSNCYIGSGSMIRQGVVIGDGSIIGMGAVVVKDVPAGSTVAGNPAHLLVRNV
jgi:sugar O-acyltransferase (sialic acid O-acetyltransferase NeuD family)